MFPRFAKALWTANIEDFNLEIGREDVNEMLGALTKSYQDGFQLKAANRKNISYQTIIKLLDWFRFSPNLEGLQYDKFTFHFFSAFNFQKLPNEL